jgi:membrane protease YdiL (CAAX protease family)
MEGEGEAEDQAAGEGSAAPAPESAPPRDTRAIAAGIAIGSTLATTAVMGWAFDPERAGQSSMLVAIGANYAVLTAIAVARLRQKGELLTRFRPAGGDVTFGALCAGALYGVARIVGSLLAAHGSPREMWLVRLYLQLGDPDAPGRMLVGVAVFAVAALEEIAWRGLVMRSLEDVLGGLRACVLTAALFAVAHLPTLFLLRAPGVGYNPLVVLAAFGCGLVWGLMVLRTRRLLPAIIAHALFSWAVIEFPLWMP